MGVYIEILANQRPTSIGLDALNRHLFSFNVRARGIAALASWEEDLAKLIADASLGVLGTTLFIGAGAIIPEGAGPFVQILDSGGIESDETHNGDAVERPTAQIVTRASTYTTGRTRALAVWNLLDGQRGVTVTP